MASRRSGAAMPSSKAGARSLRPADLRRAREAGFSADDQRNTNQSRRPRAAARSEPAVHRLRRCGWRNRYSSRSAIQESAGSVEGGETFARYQASQSRAAASASLGAPASQDGSNAAALSKAIAAASPSGLASAIVRKNRAGRARSPVRPGRQRQRAGREQRGARVETVFGQGRDKERAGFGALPQTRRQRGRFALDGGIKRFVRGKRACGSIRPGIARLPGSHPLAARHDLDPDRRPGIFPAKFRKLPLPPEQPQRIMHTRFQAGQRIAGDRLRLEPRPAGCSRMSPARVSGSFSTATILMESAMTNSPSRKRRRDRRRLQVLR